MNEKNHEELLATDNSVINALIYFKLFKCGKKMLKKLYATCEQAYMVNLEEIRTGNCSSINERTLQSCKKTFIRN